MRSTNSIVYAVLIAVGLHPAWRGVRGLQGKANARYGLLSGALVKTLPPEDRDKTDQRVLKAGAVVRIVMGLVIAGIGVCRLMISPGA